MAHLLHIDSSPRGDRTLADSQENSLRLGSRLIRLMSSLTGMSVAIPFPMWMKHGLPRLIHPQSNDPSTPGSDSCQRSTG